MYKDKKKETLQQLNLMANYAMKYTDELVKKIDGLEENYNVTRGLLTVVAWILGSFHEKIYLASLDKESQQSVIWVNLMIDDAREAYDVGRKSAQEILNKIQERRKK